MIKSFNVTGLKGIGDHELKFYPDLNILTGKNGSGKTTLLKLIWYMLSPNVERTIPEIIFKRAKLVTDEFTLTLNRKNVRKRELVEISYVEGHKPKYTAEVLTDEFKELGPIDKIEEVNRRIANLPSGSVFFPTFRRIEGGFSIEEHRRSHPYIYRVSSDLSESVSAYSDMMTVRTHRFIASISTEDVEDLLTKQYADMSDKTNDLHTELSKFLTQTIKTRGRTGTKQRSESEQLSHANKLLEKIRKRVKEIEDRRTQLLRPFLVLSELISQIFKDKGIRISSNLTFGETKRAIQANILSAGEKQMLSFLCYNAFTRNSPIFVDEPELSLHIDWQRVLFSTLLSQDTGNQFIVSTHSPFIYSKYPERELVLDIDRGSN